MALVSGWVCPLCEQTAEGMTTPGARCARDGRVLVSPATMDATLDGGTLPDPVLGHVIGGRYAVYDRLGRGGMGVVYRAVQLNLGRHVALKTITAEASERAGIRRRFEQEARLLSELRHPGIVTVYDFGEQAGVLYMVLELIGGRSLAEHLRDTPRLLPERAVDIAGQLLRALAEPHRRGLVHRDIKPDNIMLDPGSGARERVVLIDFGIAKPWTGHAHGGPLTNTGQVVGTPRYMAPEQFSSGEIGPWTDHYAVGVVLYRLLAGHSPFNGAPAEMVAAHLRDPPPRLPPELGLDPFDAVIQRAMAKRPADRYANGEDFAEAIEAALDAMDEPTLRSPMFAPSPALLPTVVSAPPTRPRETLRVETSADAIERDDPRASVESDEASPMGSVIVAERETAPNPGRVWSRTGSPWWMAAALAAVMMGAGYLGATRGDFDPETPGTLPEPAFAFGTVASDARAAWQDAMAMGVAADGTGPIEERTDGGASDLGASDLDVPVLGASDLGASDLGMPVLRAPDIGASDRGASDRGASDRGASALGASALGASARGTPSHGASGRDASARVMPVIAAPVSATRAAASDAMPPPRRVPAPKTQAAGGTLAGTRNEQSLRALATPAATRRAKALAGRIDADLAACRCVNARHAIDELTHLDPSRGERLRGTYTRRCGFVGLGCLAPGGVSAP